MRDYLLIALIFGSMPLAVFNPFIGILAWSWISYMNPHRLSWSIAYSMPVAQLVGASTLLGIIVRGVRDRFPMERETLLLLLLWTVFFLSTLFAEYPQDAWGRFVQVSKVLLMTAATMWLCLERKRLRYLLLTIALSLGFYGFKGGIFSIATGGRYKVWGPPESFIGDNNEIALALLMAMPMLHYLAQETVDRRGRLFLRATFYLSAVSVIFSYSRGGFLGLAAVILLLATKARQRVLVSALLAIVIAGGSFFIPAAWFQRMGTIQRYSEESSARGRLNAWGFAWNVACDRPLLGAGFECFEPEMFYRYAPNPLDFHDAHSIYFEALGEQGFLGFGIFAALLLSSLGTLRRIRRTVRETPSAAWLARYSDMAEVSIVAYMVSGAFLGVAYFDLYYHVIAVVVILKVLTRREMAQAGASANA
jgi:probable O-glycosylation ligase (exosortase A-associated)